MMIELKCLTCIHGELCSYKHGGVDLAIISGDCKSYKSTADVVPKSEVAREIFKEMQSCLIQRHWNGLDIVSFEFDAVKYAELKKKYTESEDKV